jgi:hypothetical protein
MKIQNKNPAVDTRGPCRIRPGRRFQSPQQHTGPRCEIKGPPSTNTTASHDVPVVVAPDEAIIGLHHECGTDFWKIHTPAGTLRCSTRGLVRFKRFRNRCAYRLGLAFSSRATQAEWLDILEGAARKTEFYELLRRFLDEQVDPIRFDAMGEPE